MVYDWSGPSVSEFIGLLVRAEDLVARIDERLRKSPAAAGFVERAHFHDAVAALWIEGELVHVEDLVLHDAMMDVRTPTHELTRAHAVLRTRRRIFSQASDWALSRAGLSALVGRESAGPQGSEARLVERPGDAEPLAESDPTDDDEPVDELALQLAEIDAVLARSQRLLDGTTATNQSEIDAAIEPAPDSSNTGTVANIGQPAPIAARSERNELIMDADWDEEQRLAEWLELAGLPHGEATPLLTAALAWDAWEQIAPLQRQAWLGNLLAASALRRAGKTASHLFALNTGLRTVARDRRRARDRHTRLAAFLEGAAAAAEAGLKELDRLAMARVQMERRLRNRRSNSSLPALIELVLSRPMVSTGLVAKELGVTQRAALGLIGELDLRELTGRGRFRAWGIV
ncbi:RHE_PE00001 family protein [Pseudaminobacter soli (ex Li et al. 2025)]|uniref:Uncharacterized protein n=1 Tax=Pseudaminobacter soli (ex Li et al. 2025) TaxID=1295366 RepID=A0A2P7RPM4_9HYPH|nr:RHE_PE00001 family protein [Mesorhizobium soli]PSJ52156.1 hypothetical protein C7I85_29185 [Mesorhizobium soli]